MSIYKLPQEYQEALLVVEKIAKAQLDALNIPPSVVVNWDITLEIESPRRNYNCNNWVRQKFIAQVGPLIRVWLVLNYELENNADIKTGPVYTEYLSINQLKTDEATGLQIPKFEGGLLDLANKDGLHAVLKRLDLSSLLDLSILCRRK